MKTEIYLYNSLTRKKEKFIPIAKGKVGMYVCGPTIDGPGHIGHAVTYTAFDIIKRIFEYIGYSVKYIMNLTDIHDKVIEKARESSIDFLKYADKYSNVHISDLKKLNLQPPDRFVRVTDHIPEIIEFIEVLKKKGLAYVAKDGVYYDVSKFKDYGKLSRIKFEKGLAGQRVSADKFEKKEPVDFALWKFKKDGEPFWKSPWGEGRPGWHIECSAMSIRYLGNPFDIHGGGLDLRFPHHENEIAQSEGAFGEDFAHYWLHSGLLKIDGQKMSKSLGNIITIPEILKNFEVSVFRYWRISSHYRSPIDFSEDSLKDADKALNRLRNKVLELRAVTNSAKNPSIDMRYRKRFVDAITNDFNTPEALSVLWELVKDKSVIDKVKLSTILDFDRVFGLELAEYKSGPMLKKEKELVKELVKRREEARKKKDFVTADRIRNELAQKGVLLKDTRKGVVWIKD